MGTIGVTLGTARLLQKVGEIATKNKQAKQHTKRCDCEHRSHKLRV